MHSLNNITGAMLMRFINKTGYTKVRQRGSHIRYKHLHRPTITLNVTGKKVIKSGRLNGLIKEMGMNKTDFFEFFHIQAKA